jgi:sugar phosphate isomerase/epimerase
MRIGICSFSFHRLLAAGRQDVFQYITDCRDLGCTELDPWNAHLALVRKNDEAVTPEREPSQLLSDEERDYVQRVREAADAAGLGFGTIAADGAHIYDPDPKKRRVQRLRAYRWLDVAARLGARQVRIDCGGPEDLPADVLAVIQDGYADIIERAGAIEVLVENHFGPSIVPDNVVKLLESIAGLGLLYDTHNWKAGTHAEARVKCARFARAVHIKTLAWNDAGEPVGSDIAADVRALWGAGFRGPWCIESVPKDGDEHAGVMRTIGLLEKLVPAG